MECNGSIYMGKWYEYDIKSRKAILMEGAIRPMQIIAGKLLDASMNSFMWVN